tara:strand:+ start:219 stop:377 length:159 start_codon:yes stop_codon:yes gene_type:complete
VAQLRPVAKKRLGKIGKVIFGLSENEVGHMSPQWSKTDEAVSLLSTLVMGNG